MKKILIIVLSSLLGLSFLGLGYVNSKKDFDEGQDSSEELEEINEIPFSFVDQNGNSFVFYCVSGMTWRDYIESDYNTFGFYIREGSFVCFFDEENSEELLLTFTDYGYFDEYIYVRSDYYVFYDYTYFLMTGSIGQFAFDFGHDLGTYFYYIVDGERWVSFLGPLLLTEFDDYYIKEDFIIIVKDNIPYFIYNAERDEYVCYYDYLLFDDYFDLVPVNDTYFFIDLNGVKELYVMLDYYTWIEYDEAYGDLPLEFIYDEDDRFCYVLWEGYGLVMFGDRPANAYEVMCDYLIYNTSGYFVLDLGWKASLQPCLPLMTWEEFIYSPFNHLGLIYDSDLNAITFQGLPITYETSHDKITEFTLVKPSDYIILEEWYMLGY